MDVSHNNNYKMQIIELSYSADTLEIGVEIRGPYNPVIKDPKLAVIFDNGQQTRRLPLLVKSYFPVGDCSEGIIFAQYSYCIPDLFVGKNQDSKFQIRFEFAYGNILIEDMKFTVNSDVKIEENDSCQLTYSENEMQYEKYKNSLKEQSKSLTKLKGKKIRCIFGEIWKIFLCVLGVALLPVFLVESLLVSSGCLRNMQQNRKKGIKRIINHIILRYKHFIYKSSRVGNYNELIFRKAYTLGLRMQLKKNRVLFVSDRRNDISGNFEYVYDILKNDESLDIKFALNSEGILKMNYVNLIRSAFYCATSQVILMDDFSNWIYSIPRRPGTSLLQLWHACGAFKTFGFSRLGKPGGPKQSNMAHRNYDHCIVSSQEIAKFYAEGFGISLDKPVATGIPRTDIFFNDVYKHRVKEDFYQKYPKLKEKKIILFAPTFRGNGKLSSFYPTDKFDAVKLYESLAKEYAIIIKHHPFVKERNMIPKEYSDVIIDMSEESELNDLLFVTDVLISDYSSVIFEASLLDIPMLFFAYDLQQYISSRGFYYEYEEFVPGKIVSKFEELIESIHAGDFEAEKLQSFKTKFFDDLDGKSSQRTVELIYKELKK